MRTYTYRRNPEDNSKLADTDAVQSIVDASKKAVETYSEIQKLSTLEQDLRALCEAQNNAGGLKGFIMKSLEIAEKNHTEHRALVIDDNGFADLILKNSENVNPISCVYKPGKINFAELKEAGIERFLLNNNHPNFNVLVEEAKQYGINLEPTKHFAAECQMIADGMQLEYKITGNPISFFVPHAYTTNQAFNLIAQRGVAAAGAAAKFGGALAVGVAVASVLSGDKTMREAAEDAFVNVTDAAFYGAAGNMIMSTALGPIVATSLTSVAEGIAARAACGQIMVAGTAVMNAASAASAAGAIFAVGGATATAVTEVASLAAAGTYAMGMGGVSAGILSLGGGVATTIGAITGGAAIATGTIAAGATAAMGAVGAAASAVFCPPVAIGLGLIGAWRWLKNR